MDRRKDREKECDTEYTLYGAITVQGICCVIFHVIRFWFKAMKPNMWAYIKTITKISIEFRLFSPPQTRDVIQEAVWSIFEFITKGQITMLSQLLSVKN